jgi:hypothetical protein
MKEQNNLPGDAPLNALLRQARPAPGLPPRFQENVWRRIEDSEAPAASASWLDALVALILRPRFAMAAAVVMLAAGILAGTLDGRQLARHDAEMNYLASVAPASVR